MTVIANLCKDVQWEIFTGQTYVRSSWKIFLLSVFMYMMYSKINKYMNIHFWERKFLDSGKIISDETFCTQSQIMVEKVPEFSAESLWLRQGMVT